MMARRTKRHIAFYAPLKAPSHPIPSGDRRMGRLLIQAFEAGGARVEVASDFRAYDGKGDPARQMELRNEGTALADGLIKHYRAQGAADRPTVWFTYHLYHKAPDWLGPKVAQALDIPYLIAEPSYAPKRAGGCWDLGHNAAAEAIAAADWVFCLTQLDMACVRPLITTGHHLEFLPPFLDSQAFSEAAANRDEIARRFGAGPDKPLDPEKPWLLAVAMMRPGDKLDSFERLGAGLDHLQRRGLKDWQLIVVGDGPARRDVEAVLAPIADNVIMTGELPPKELPAIYASCDLYIWPGVGEAYGMAYLEAQAAGLPVIAGNERGVPDVVMADKTGLLTTPGADDEFSNAVARLLEDGPRRHKLSNNARAFVAKQRTVAAAAQMLSSAMEALQA